MPFQVKSKENVVSRAPQPVPLEEPAAVTKAHTAAAAAAPIGPATVPDHKTRPHRSTSLSSGGSQHLTSLRRSLSKVRFNIDHAAEWPLRVRRVEPGRRVLPPVPDPGRVAKRSDDGTLKSGQEHNEGVRLVCRVKPSTQFAQDRMVVSDQVRLVNAPIIWILVLCYTDSYTWHTVCQTCPEKEDRIEIKIAKIGIVKRATHSIKYKTTVAYGSNSLHIFLYRRYKV